MKFAGGCPAASFFLLLAQKKETKEKGTLPRRRYSVPCAPRSNRSLRNSHYALRQCSFKISLFDFVAWRLRRDLVKNIPASTRPTLRESESGGYRDTVSEAEGTSD
jgi:hypothetical protein